MGNDNIEDVLTDLNRSLEKALATLGGSGKNDLMARLHDPMKLPERTLYDLSMHTVDLVHDVRQLLEPRTLILADHFLGYASCKCLNAAVEFEIPEVLDKGPMSISDLAQASGAREDRLKQIMQVLHNDSVFDYDESTKTYANNECSQLLLANHWTGWRNWVDLYGNEFYDMARGIPAACRKGEERMPAQINFQTDLDMFTWFAEQGSLDRVHRTLGGAAIAQAPGILEDYPWEEVTVGKIIDVGGGGGGLVASLLRKFPRLRAGIFDRPEVIAQAKSNFHSPLGLYADVGARVDAGDLHAGDFFKEIPSYEVYCMKWCLHDWDDANAIKILSNIRKAIIPGPSSRLVLLEILLRGRRSGYLSRMADMSVFMAAKGMERDDSEWRMLASQSGWQIKRIYDLRNAWPCAMELIPV